MSLTVKIKKRLDHMTLHADFFVDQEVVSLFGASGTGKSMILKCIAGLETPDEGRIVLNGRVLFDSEKKINVKPAQRRTGYVFQNYALFPNMTVAQNIGLAVAKHERKQIVEEAVKMFRLEGLEEAMPNKLSGGQKQRVSIARMYATKPELVLLDEPFSALDNQLARELIHEMQGFLEKTACPVLFVSHNREEVFQLSNRLGVMEEGHLGNLRPTKEVFANPSTIEEAKLCGCDNIIRITEPVKELFGLDASLNGAAAVGIYSDRIQMSRGAGYTISLTGTITKRIEEINRICYEVLLRGQIPFNIKVSSPKYANENIEAVQAGSIVELYLRPDEVHLLLDGGNQ